MDSSMSDDASAPASVHIEVISDVVCPWCYIGKRRLETALTLTLTVGCGFGSVPAARHSAPAAPTSPGMIQERPRA